MRCSKSSSKVVLWLFGVCLLVFVPASAQETKIFYLKNGNTITGRIIEEESTDEYYIVDIFTGKTAVPKSLVLNIMEGEAYLDARNRADAAKKRKEWIKAALTYQQALESTNNHQIRQECRKEIEGISLEIINELNAGNPQDLPIEQSRFVVRLSENQALVDQFDRVVQAVQNQSLQKWLAAGKRAFETRQYEQALRHLDQVIADAPAPSAAMQEARRLKARIYVEQARPLYRSWNPSEQIQAEQYLNQALEVRPDDDLAHFMLGVLCERTGRAPKALEHLLLVRDTSVLTEDERGVLRRRIQDIQERFERKKARAQVASQRAQPSERGFASGLTERLSRMFSDLRGKAPSGTPSTIWLQVRAAVPLALFALAFLVFLWYLPYRTVKWHAGKQPFLKRDYVRLAKRMGVIGLLIYCFSLLLTQKPKITCPHCAKALDTPEVFEDWNFNLCPFCHKTIKAPYKMQDYIQALAASVARERASGDARKKGDAMSLASKDSTLKLIRAIITYAVRLRASDIHIEAEDPGDLLFRFRIDGVLHDGVRLPLALHSPVITATKNLAQLDIAERRVPQDGHFSLIVERSELNVRVATTPTRTGEKAVLRLLVPRESVLQMTQLGFSAEGLMKFEKAILSPHGIILATGPTGSGKSTTLYSAISLLADGQRNIITIEDPIEYEIAGVNQMQVNTKAGLTFGNALRSILRQDPDVIMVGEIRDRETAEMATSASLTGHLVFSTLHTIDSCTALSRLIDLGVEPKQVASAVVAIIAQRLVRKICPKCKKAYRPRDEELQKLGVSRASLSEDVRFYIGHGCDECRDSGYIGRTGLFEVLLVQSGRGQVQKALEAGASTSAIRDAARRDGMTTLREEGISKVLQGITTVAEVLRVTQDELYNLASEAWKSGEMEHMRLVD